DRVIVDSEDDVLHTALARGREQDLRGSGAGEVLGQPLLIAPSAGVVDDDRIVAAVGGVVDLGRVIGVADLDEGAIGLNGVGFLIDDDAAVEGTVDRVAAQQGSALDDVVLPIAADDDRAQTHSGPAGTIDEDACQETADAAESVEDDIADFALAGL